MGWKGRGSQRAECRGSAPDPAPQTPARLNEAAGAEWDGEAGWDERGGVERSGESAGRVPGLRPGPRASIAGEAGWGGRKRWEGAGVGWGVGRDVKRDLLAR
ncbi:hypothetical protein Slala04_16600 [Streptomyces lavendulae subsp. lavendulae]|nr:hypothetical protein Slala04_16600 [Streptomyces lavendulae subsp. lavendulae]